MTVNEINVSRELLRIILLEVILIKKISRYPYIRAWALREKRHGRLVASEYETVMWCMARY